MLGFVALWCLVALSGLGPQRELVSVGAELLEASYSDVPADAAADNRKLRCSLTASARQEQYDIVKRVLHKLPGVNRCRLFEGTSPVKSISSAEDMVRNVSGQAVAVGQV